MPKTQHSWSYAELEKLSAVVKQHGRRWEFIQRQCFPHISLQGIRNMYYKQLREDLQFGHKREVNDTSSSQYPKALDYNCFKGSDDQFDAGQDEL